MMMDPEPSREPAPEYNSQPAQPASHEFKSICSKIVAGTRLAQQSRPSTNFETLLAEFAGQLKDGRFDLRLAGDIRIMIAHRIEEISDSIDKQLDLVIHEPAFQQLEASWRGLFHLVETTTISEDLVVKVLNTSRQDLEKDLKIRNETSVTESGLFEKVFRDQYNTFGGTPFGVLIGDFEFSHDPRDVSNYGLLTKLSQVAAAAHAPFVAAANPKMFGLGRYKDLTEARNLRKIFKDDPDYDAWNAFRKTEESRYVALTLPHILLREPYGAGDGVKEGDTSAEYRETVEGADDKKYLWGNAAYSLAGLMAESFAEYGWCVSIRGPEGGGLLSKLPLHVFTTELGDKETKCPTEVKISNDRDFALAELGFTPVVHRTSTPKDEAVFNDVPSCHLPDEFLNTNDRANAYLGSKIPYMMLSSRIAHFIKKRGDEKVGSVTDPAQLENDLNSWIRPYVDPRPDFDAERRRNKPLRAAQIKVEAVPGRPGFFTATAFIEPHFQLEGLNVTVSLVANLGSEESR